MNLDFLGMGEVHWLTYCALHSGKWGRMARTCLLLLIFKAKVLTQMVPPEEQFYWDWAASSGDVGQVSQAWVCGQGCRVLFPIDQLLPWAFAVLPLPPPCIPSFPLEGVRDSVEPK